MVQHPDPSNKMFVYKPETPGAFVAPPVPGLKTPAHEAPTFLPSRSRPTFSDNASLELLYSFFSTGN